MAYELGASTTILNRQGLTTLTLSAQLARKPMFFHILNINRDVYWRIGNLASAAYPLDGIDTIDQKTGEIVPKSALNLIAFGVRLDATRRYLTLLDATRRYLALLSATLRYSTLFDATRRYSTLLDATRRYSTLLDATRRYSTLLDATRRYSTLLHATRRYSTQLYATLLYAMLYFK
jgi:hypothetical protein